MDATIHGPFGAAAYLTGMSSGQIAAYVVIARTTDGRIVTTGSEPKFRTRVKLIADGLAAHTQDDINKVAELGRQRDERRDGEGHVSRAELDAYWADRAAWRAASHG